MASSKRIDVTVVPAQPGYFVIHACSFEGECTAADATPAWYDDVIAWRVETYESSTGSVRSVVDPIIASGCLSSDDYAILRPDGCFDIPHDRTLKDLEAYVAYVKGESNG